LSKQKLLENKVLFIVNPVSGYGNKDQILEAINIFCKNHNLNYHIYIILKENNENQLERLQQSFQAQTAVIAGGDGTLFHLLPFLRKHSLTTALIPTGTANGFATELGIPKTLKKSLNTLLKGTVKTIDLLSVNGKLVAHLCDIGFNAKLVKRFEQDTIKGFRGYAKHFIDVLRTHKSKKYLITDENGQKIKYKAHMLIVTNAKKYGTGAVVNPEARIDDGKFELIVIRYYSFWHIVQMFFVLFTKQIHRMHYVHISKHSEITIKNIKGKIVNLDGEIHTKLINLHIKNIPKALKIITPN